MKSVTHVDELEGFTIIDVHIAKKTFHNCHVGCLSRDAKNGDLIGIFILSSRFSGSEVRHIDEGNRGNLHRCFLLILSFQNF